MRMLSKMLSFPIVMILMNSFFEVNKKLGSSGPKIEGDHVLMYNIIF